MFGLNNEELRILKKLDSYKKVQDFIDSIPINHEEEGDTCLSPRRVLREKKCHCMEGAMLAALALRIHGKEPLVVDLTANNKDFDHVITVFKNGRKWGAISKTNHAVLRFREPIYNSLRELIMSYFHEYFDDKGRKNLRSYSRIVNLSIFDKQNWTTNEEDVWFIPEYLARIKHHKILNKKQIINLRRASRTEIMAGRIVEWKKKFKIYKPKKTLK